MSTDVHYLWIGPPNIAQGQDTIGPDLLREKYPGQPIHFWCLDEHVKAYNDYFNKSGKQGAPIHVHSIEMFLVEKDKAHPGFLEFVEALKDSAEKQSVKADSVRERVTIKAAMQYFLQIYHSGYFMDTNIIPDPQVSKDTPIKPLEAFTVPMLWNITARRDFIDPWLMYCPQLETGAKERFLHYFHETKAEFEERRADLSNINRLALSRTFVETASKHPNTETENASMWNEDIYKILCFQKRYSNTHKHKDEITHKVPLLHYILLTFQNKREFQYYLEKSKLQPCDIYKPFNSREKKFESNTTLLHTAIIQRYAQKLDLLLAKVEDPSVIFKNPQGVTGPSPIQLALIPHPSEENFECANSLLNFYFERCHIDKDLFFKTVTQLATALDALSPDTLKGADTFMEVTSMESLVASLKTPRADIYQKAIYQTMSIGPLMAENLACYVDVVREEHEAIHRERQRVNASIFDPLFTLFGQGPAPIPVYDSKGLEKTLSSLILQQSDGATDDVTTTSKGPSKSPSKSPSKGHPMQ